MVIVSHPTGNAAHVRNATVALAASGLLGEFWTGVNWDPEWPINHLLPRALRAQLGRRALPEIVRSRTHYLPWREAGRMLAGRLGWARLDRHEVGPCSIDAVYRGIDRHVARRLPRLRGVSGVYAYEDGAAETFAAARSLGITCLYDLPIGYWRAAHDLYTEEAERLPEWACTLTGMNDSPAKLARKDAELAGADTIIVASSFTRQTIQSAPSSAAPIHVIPYGAPPAIAEGAIHRQGEALRVFFAGSLSQRKGLAYLLQAVEMLGNRVELTLLGTKVTDACPPLNAALRRHRWIPTLPHQEVLREMSHHDVFVFPSLFEGFGLVLLEAMAHGLPIITTSHTAGPDLIENGREGFIVPIRSAEAIAEKLDLLARDSPLLSAMKIAALRTATRRDWETYQSRLSTIVQQATTAIHL